MYSCISLLKLSTTPPPHTHTRHVNVLDAEVQDMKKKELERKRNVNVANFVFVLRVPSLKISLLQKHYIFNELTCISHRSQERL